MAAAPAGVRASERASALFFGYATVWSFVLPVADSIRVRMMVVNGLLLVALFLARRIPDVIRDWAPGALILLAYNEMGWLALPQTGRDFEDYWVEWDRWLLRDLGLKTAIESAGPVGPALLEVAYTLVYPIIPIALSVSYVRRKPELTERVAFPLLLACLCTYGLFPFFPSDTPRRVYPGELFTAHDTVFRKFNWWLCEGGGIHTSVFPSGHVSSAIAAAWGVRRVFPEAVFAWRFLATAAVGIFLATIYGRYHYAVDSVAGAAVAVMVLALTQGWATRPSRTHSANGEPSGPVPRH